MFLYCLGYYQEGIIPAGSLYHVPEEVGQPVDEWTDTADKLQVFGLGDPLLDEIENEAGRHKGHSEDDTDGHHCIHRGGQAGETLEKKHPIIQQ